MTNLKAEQTVFVVDDLTNMVASALVTEVKGDTVMLVGLETTVGLNPTKYTRNVSDVYRTVEEAAANITETDIPYPTEAEMRLEDARFTAHNPEDYVEF